MNDRVPDPDLAVALARVPTCAAMDLLREHEPERLVMRGVRALLPHKGSIAGPARTVRFLPARSDTKRSPHGPVNFELIDSVRPGEVLVFDAGPQSRGSVLGDMLARRAKIAGAAAVVTDGCMRDIAGIAEVGLPVFASEVWPVASAGSLVPWEADRPIQCGGALVMPRDWILADADAVVVIPQALAAVIVERFDESMEEELFCRQLLDRGHGLLEAFPMPPALRPLYLEYRETRALPSRDLVRRALGD